jgi:signal peptidase
MSHGGDRSPRPPSPERSLGSDDADDPGWGVFARDLATSALAVGLVGALLFAVSGVWPPLVAIESGSMEPNMEKFDLVFVMEETRFPGQSATEGTGVVTNAAAGPDGYVRFGKPGDVIVYEPLGNEDTTPIIHRAMFYVERGEDWYDRANPDYVAGASSCAELVNCPATYDGFITKGDNNNNYDQVGPNVISDPVKPAWVVGTAEVRVPGVGWLRLRT